MDQRMSMNYRKDLIYIKEKSEWQKAYLDIGISESYKTENSLQNKTKMTRSQKKNLLQY